MKKVYIYKITCTKNNKIYIGQSTNPQRRFAQHITSNKYMIDDIKKYGKESFTLDILEETVLTNSSELEELYIAKFDSCNTGYNVQKKSGQNSANARRKKQWNTGLTKETDERVKKISDALKGKYCGENSPSYGIKRSDEYRKKLSERASKRTGEKNAFYGKHHSDETKHKISKTQSEKMRANPRIWVNDGNKDYYIFPNELNEYLEKGYIKGRVFKRRNR